MSYRHYPRWLSENDLFQFLFLLRKLYLTRASFRHYSQYGEDAVVEGLLERVQDGFFVDVGCFHPRKYNNTYHLYKRGWRGVNIDLDAVKIRGFRLARPRDTSIHCAISDDPPTDGRITVYSFGFYTLIQTLSPERAEEFSRKTRLQPAAQTVPCQTLQAVLDATPYRGRRIDYLSVDCEGHDLQVLRSLDWKMYRPRLVTIECEGDFRVVMDSEITLFMRALGYELAAWTPPSLHFEAPKD